MKAALLGILDMFVAYRNLVFVGSLSVFCFIWGKIQKWYDILFFKTSLNIPLKNYIPSLTIYRVSSYRVA